METKYYTLIVASTLEVVGTVSHSDDTRETFAERVKSAISGYFGEKKCSIALMADPIDLIRQFEKYRGIVPVTFRAETHDMKIDMIFAETQLY